MPKLLDLFCCAGGAARGYAKAGFDVTGIDIAYQKNYPFKFIQADALEYVAAHGHEYDIIHASPVCKGYSGAGVLAAEHRKQYALQIPDVRAALIATGKPYIIENVARARWDMISPIELCGCMFPELSTYRVRLFETHPQILFTPYHAPHTEAVLPAGRGRREGGKYFAITSGGITGVSQLERFQAMGHETICMTSKELNESIPPQFAEWIGRRMLALIAQEGA